MARPKKTKSTFEYSSIKFKDELSFEDYLNIVNSVSDSVANQLLTDGFSTKEVITTIAIVESCTDISINDMSELEKWNLYTKTYVVKDIISHIGDVVYNMLINDINRTIEYKLSFNNELKKLSESLIEYVSNASAGNGINAQNIEELKSLVSSLENYTNNNG